jgi:hypothetical protein
MLFLYYLKKHFVAMGNVQMAVLVRAALTGRDLKCWYIAKRGYRHHFTLKVSWEVR